MREAIASLSLFDHHAHNVRKAECALPFEAGFTESLDPDVWSEYAPHGVFLRRSVKQLASLFNCESSLDAVKSARAQFSLAELTKLCLEASNLSVLLLDDGLSPKEIEPWNWHNQFVPTKRLLRIEMVAEELLAVVSSFHELETEFVNRLRARGPEVIGLKSIVAYRGGLKVETVERSQAEHFFGRERPSRLHASPLYHYLIHRALEIASEDGLPIQFHTGFGDPDLALEDSNPLLLRPLIERYSCPFVLLHAGYPYFRECGFLGSVYHNVWVDFGLAVPFLSTDGMRRTVSGLLEFAPLNKILYSSDASLIPELYYLGAQNGRMVVAHCLKQLVDAGDLNQTEALEAATWILQENAERLYGRQSAGV